MQLRLQKQLQRSIHSSPGELGQQPRHTKSLDRQWLSVHTQVFRNYIHKNGIEVMVTTEYHPQAKWQVQLSSGTTLSRLQNCLMENLKD